MLTKREWAENPEVFEAVADALDSGSEEGGFESFARDEESSYRDYGYVVVEMEDRRFYLQLWEEV